MKVQQSVTRRINLKVSKPKVWDHMIITYLFPFTVAISMLEYAIKIDKEGAHFRNAAKHHQEIAEIYESDLVDLQGAMHNWEQAATLHMADDQQAYVFYIAWMVWMLMFVIGW